MPIRQRVHSYYPYSFYLQNLNESVLTVRILCSIPFARFYFTLLQMCFSLSLFTKRLIADVDPEPMKMRAYSLDGALQVSLIMDYGNTLQIQREVSNSVILNESKSHGSK